ncbi:unnamed protein product [Cuscuta europaea]|uniref:Uncharacterized protein n=1 Tax=Cuscuta europaea TaxID=41803 RepID=A0A9P1ECB3_CUSEU|nr:unnamed protein product [Cuscuta europaea]
MENDTENNKSPARFLIIAPPREQLDSSNHGTSPG